MILTDLTEHEKHTVEVLSEGVSKEDLIHRVIYYRRVMWLFKDAMGMHTNSTIDDIKNQLMLLTLIAPVDKSTT